MSETEFKEWCILELLGHVRIAGLVTEEERFGAKLGRIDIPTGDDTMVTQYFSAAGIYRMTPTTEEIARAVAIRNQPQPVQRWELPAPTPTVEHICRHCGGNTDETGYCAGCAAETARGRDWGDGDDDDDLPL